MADADLADSGSGDLAHARLVRELRVLRERGLLRLRRLELPELGSAARRAGLTELPYDPRAVELLLRRAVAALGEEEPGLAVQYLFGLVQGTAGHRPTDLRQRAAAVLGLSAETFRKEPERLLVDRVADELLRLLPATGAWGSAPLGDRPDRPDRPDRLDGLDRPHGAAGGAADLGGRAGHGTPGSTQGAVRVPLGLVLADVVVDVGPVERLRGVDVLVSAENTYLEPAPSFAATPSGRLRHAAAERAENGAVTCDVVAEELAAWGRRHGRLGNPVPPGTVVATSPGRLARRGVRRLLHAAVLVPRPGGDGYDVPGHGVARAVRACFDLARRERGPEGRVARSLGLPLLGAGEGGLSPVDSLALLWPAVRAELAADPSWRVHLLAWSSAEAAAVERGLGARPGPPVLAAAAAS